MHQPFFSVSGGTWIFKFHEKQSNGSWNCSMRTDMMKITVAFHNFANVPTGQ